MENNKESTKPNYQSGINSIEIPNKESKGEKTTDPDMATSWKRVKEPHQVKEQIMKRDISHFGQAEGTIFPSDFKYKGILKALDILLQGKFNYNTIPNSTTGASTLLKHLSNGKALPKMNCEIDFKTFIAGLRTWSESTSTSPSGRHLGHYKCLQVDDGQSHTYTQENPNPSDKILMTYYKLAMTAMRLGISLKRWQNSITTMIEKVPGNPKINELRVIHLYEADYNLLLKIIWARRLIRHAHDEDRLNNGQSGL